MEYMESRMQDQIEGALHNQQEAMERIEQLESDLATAEQDSRQKQARIERLEQSIQDLRDALIHLTRSERQYDWMYREAELALKNTEDV